MRMFFVAGIGLAVFIEFLLVSKKNKSAADQILTLWIFLALVHLFLMYLYFAEDAYSFPFLLGIEQPLPLLHGVFLYLYVATLTKQLPRRRWVLALHFVPATVMYVYLVGFFALPAEQKIQVYRSQGAGYEWFNSLKTYAIALSGVIYVTWSGLLLRKHRENIRGQFSDLDRINLQWLRVLTIGMGGIWFFVVFFRNDMLVFSGAVVFIFLIGFFGIRQSDVFAHNEPVGEDNETKRKYSKSGLTEEASGDLHSALILLMTRDALYRKSDLSIDDLSSKLGVHPNYLSQVINEKEKKNFYDFVNSYRIEEFKRLVATPKNRQYTILSLAYDCGFSSKSSFNRYFKKATGKTPSAYFAEVTKDQPASTY